jgi:transposase
MFLPSSVRIYMSDRPIDMRKGFDGLISIVRTSWQKDVFSGHLFIFLGSQGDRAKILYWEHGGFVLYSKRLERGRFKSPLVRTGQSVIELDPAELFMLLDGIDIAKVKRKEHWHPKKVS